MREKHPGPPAYHGLAHERGGRPSSSSLGQFQDTLRDLAAAGKIRLAPWTGAMYQLENPECCLLVGREIMAYATG